MLSNEYNAYCQAILSGTLQYIDTNNMPSRQIDRSKVKNGNAVYKSAVASTSPMTLVYTPPGSGKTQLLYDRAENLKSIGIKNDQIMILSMNIAKTKQIEIDQNCIAMTFSEFTHGIFKANYPDIQLSDIDSVANMLMMSNPDETTKDFITRMTLPSPKDKAVAMSIWINRHLSDAINALCSINRADYMLESIICQNMMYKFKNNPYGVTDILVNGVHNMPLPVLCSLLEYANRFHCNLFMTGYPDETIYDFNMAYDKSMDMISSIPNQKINLIRLNQTSMSQSILNMLNTARTTGLSDIHIKSLDIDTYDSTTSIAEKTLTPNVTDYISNKLKNNESILIIARSKSDINEIKTVIENSYRPSFPEIKICDLTTIQAPHTTYGTILAKYSANLLAENPETITVRELGNKLYNALDYMMNTKTSYRQKSAYKTDRDNLMQFFSDHKDLIGDLDKTWQTKDIIKLIIQIEENLIQKHMEKVRNESVVDMLDANIACSTIHSAIDLRYDNVITVMRCSDREGEDPLYHVALSRANKSEYIVFANTNHFRSKYQKYIETYIRNE